VRVHLVDGTYELFRAHFSRRPSHQDGAGRDNAATVGLVASLLALLHDPAEDVTHIAVAFDNPITSFRNALLPTYKDGAGTDPVLLDQFDAAEAAVASLGITVWSMDRFEADDALATGAWRCTDEAEQVRVMTPDKDLGQVVRGDRIVQVDRSRGIVRDEDGVRERLGVGPASVPDLLALVGDTADGIPGIPGFGAVSAAALLARYGRLEAIPLDGRWDVPVRGAARLATTLADRFDDALLYREVATLVDTGAVLGVDDLAWDGVPTEPFRAWCDAAAAGALAERPRRWAGAGS
jgi:5'-3' exonuclease